MKSIEMGSIGSARHFLNTVLTSDRMKFLALSMSVSLICVFGGCRDSQFEARYQSLNDAASQGAITRQWVPEFLPKSSRNIHVIGDLSPSREWCAFEFSPDDSESLRNVLTPLGALPLSLKKVPAVGKPWWPTVLEGDLDVGKIHNRGLELYMFRQPATSLATASELFAVNWSKGQGFFYESPSTNNRQAMSTGK